MVASLHLGARGGEEHHISIIGGDDIGHVHISAYNYGMMGYKTPHIDSNRCRPARLHRLVRPAKSCTAGVAAFISRQSACAHPASPRSDCRRKGGLERRIRPDPGELLKPHGYATGQFGKNHLGDRNEICAHGPRFDEWLATSTTMKRKRSRRMWNYPAI